MGNFAVFDEKVSLNRGKRYIILEKRYCGTLIRKFCAIRRTVTWPMNLIGTNYTQIPIFGRPLQVTVRPMLRTVVLSCLSCRLASLGHLSKFQRISRLGLVTAATSLNRGQPNFARCLAVSCAGTLLPPNGIMPGAKLTLRTNLAFSYIGSVTARHWNSGRQPNFAA